MAIDRLDIVLVIDIESTCWKGPAPRGQISDIIEVGLCLVDMRTLERTEKRRILVKPQRSEVSAFCTELTGITSADVATGISLPDACDILKQTYACKERLWASYGEYDRKHFKKCCREQGFDYPFGDGHLNINSLLGIARGLGRQPGLTRAMDMLELPFEGQHHRGDDDAWNAAAVLIHMLKKIRGDAEVAPQ
jgi:inhibitor of KinA sporulation pathway (predicted exonuclease)